VLAVKVAWVLPAGIVTEAGILKAEEVSERETRLPPDGAAAERNTVQVVVELESRLPAAHCSAEREAGGRAVVHKARPALLEELFREAVMTAV